MTGAAQRHISAACSLLCSAGREAEQLSSLFHEVQCKENNNKTVECCQECGRKEIRFLRLFSECLFKDGLLLGLVTQVISVLPTVVCWGFFVLFCFFPRFLGVNFKDSGDK